MTNLIEVLKEQASFGFTGKVNVLSKENGQFLGVIYQQEGMIVGAQLKELKGKKALLKMIFDDVESNELFKFIVEPEVLSPENITLKITFEEVRKEAQGHFQEYLSAKKLRPAPHLKLVIDPEIIVSIESITPQEFDVLSVITEWCNVSDIYKYSKLMDFEVTHALVSLRKKRAIKVFQN
ncbi:hypothetical protein SHI21_01445 [Bacteriovorax sp. PP10]|uniref:DUF4388 domain-containing protein n=1 Tax=Bacteriovorax antarcticus TaxID=3088717 RepID=A0ABU5VP69_9BACT|nr:hypothetical protein [Bacteriovorax sp. PP10]MEA9354846.1 hypothetical protein [Bacteriovorax sp. PP10]